jgi:hypothetical protein
VIYHLGLTGGCVNTFHVTFLTIIDSSVWAKIQCRGFHSLYQYTLDISCRSFGIQLFYFLIKQHIHCQIMLGHKPSHCSQEQILR